MRVSPSSSIMYTVLVHYNNTQLCLLKWLIDLETPRAELLA